MAEESRAKARLEENSIVLPLTFAQGGIRIADSAGNHTSAPTRALFTDGQYVEWMITNHESQLLSGLFSDDEKMTLINDLKNIASFAQETKYAVRETSPGKEEIDTFDEFKVYRYQELFHSFEKELPSTLKVRLTFKLGDYGVVAHPHMYVLIPFSYPLLTLKNALGVVARGAVLGSGCQGEMRMSTADLKDVLLTLACASKKHRNDLVAVLST